jgi:predicted esterase
MPSSPLVVFIVARLLPLFIYSLLIPLSTVAMTPKTSSPTITITTSTSTSTSTTSTTSMLAIAKPRILCLHGLSQSGTIFSNKIGGARRKLARRFDLDFLDGPVALVLVPEKEDATTCARTAAAAAAVAAATAPSTTTTATATFGWWIRDETSGEHNVGQLQAPFDYIRDYAKGKDYVAVLGFSQGGLLATALALSGDMPSLKAVITAGAPHVDEPFATALARAADADAAAAAAAAAANKSSILELGRAIPKLHFAGDTDAIIAVERVQKLSQEGGNGTVILHEKGHLFPTKAAQVNAMVEFLEEHLLSS